MFCSPDGTVRYAAMFQQTTVPVTAEYIIQILLSAVDPLYQQTNISIDPASIQAEGEAIFLSKEINVK